MGYLNSYFTKSAAGFETVDDIISGNMYNATHGGTSVLPTYQAADDAASAAAKATQHVGNFRKSLRSAKDTLRYGSRALKGWAKANPKKALLGAIGATMLGGVGMGAIAESGRPKPKKDNPYAGGYY